MSTLLLTYRQVAERCSVSHSTVKQWASHGLLPVVRMGHRSARISETALDEFVAQHTTPAARRGN
jgi:excisionase family DNA binding protein